MFNLADAVAKANAEYFITPKGRNWFHEEFERMHNEPVEQPIGAQVIPTDSPLYQSLLKPERYDSGETFERPRMSEDERERLLDNRARMEDFR